VLQELARAVVDGDLKLARKLATDVLDRGEVGARVLRRVP
jgi:hypothetical protein